MLLLFSFFVYLTLSQVPTICSKYSRALNLTNNALVTTVVTGVVPKIVATGTPTKSFFDGTRPAGSTNFLANKPAFDALVMSLVSFFGAGLGCSDGTIPPYSGPSMERVHRPLGISDQAFEFFNLQVIGVMRVAGVTENDLSTVLTLLVSLRSQITNPNICDKYSGALGISNKQLVTTVVTGTFKEITKPMAPTLPFFNGKKPPGSTNFLTNQRALMALVGGLVSFFGDALSCSDGTIDPYTGGTLKAVHSGMGITNNVFDFFNIGGVIKVMRGAGVAQNDLTTVLMLLNSTRKDIVTA